MSAEMHGCERRSEPRRRSAGDVTLWPESGMSAAIRAELVDESRHGFRVRHGSPGITPGQTVSFEAPGTAGRARVVWTRMFGGQVESGFVFLPGNGQTRR